MDGRFHRALILLGLALLASLLGLPTPGRSMAQAAWTLWFVEEFNGGFGNSGWTVHSFGGGDEITFQTDGSSQVLRVDNASTDGGGDDRAGFAARALSIPAGYNEWALEVRLRFPERTGLGMLFSVGTGTPGGCSNGTYWDYVENILRVHANSSGAQVMAFAPYGSDLGISDIAGSFFTVRLEVYAGGTWSLWVNGSLRDSGTVPSGRTLGGLHIGNYRYGCEFWGNWTSVHVD
ncbi:MAG: hypothetical protein RMM10_12955, partial [Anaerolineae bacterium]|uniref:hypothetical protein n=1 Tax=Thermoflexus sp. TaxID=1969742 RepID=UPI0025CC0560